MNRQTYLLLLTITILVVAGVLLMLTGTPQGRGVSGDQALLPDLAGQINEVDTLEVSGPGHQLLARMQRTESAWVLTSLENYPASWSKLREVLAALAQARVLEPKTDNPEYFDRLGVEDISSESAAGQRLLLSTGDQQFAIVLGSPAAKREARYARIDGENQTYLVSFTADVPRNPIDWVDREVVDLPASLVAEVQILHADGEQLSVRKLSADDTDFQLVDAPDGREPASSWAVNSLGGVFADLQMDDVRRADALDWDSAVTLTALSFSGLQLNAKLISMDDQWWVRLKAEEIDSGAADQDKPELPASATPTDMLEVPGSESSIQAQVDSIQERVNGWAYQIPAYKAEAMNKRLEDLLKPVDAE